MLAASLLFTLVSLAHADSSQPADRVSCSALNKQTGQRTQISPIVPLPEVAAEFGNQFEFKDGAVTFKAQVDRWVGGNTPHASHSVDPYILMQATEIFPSGKRGPEILDQAFFLRDMKQSEPVGILNFISLEGAAYDFKCEFN